MNKPKYKVPTQPVWAKVAAILAYAGAILLLCISLALFNLEEVCEAGASDLLEMQAHMEELRV